MGVYSNNRTNLNDVDVVANENYIGGGLGNYQMMIDNARNELTLFESVIKSDIEEVMAVQEGADVEPLMEASLTGMGERVKAFVMKVWEKVKGLFQTFMTKIQSVVMTDNKKFVKKFEKQILMNSDAKVEWAGEISPYFEAYSDIVGISTSVKTAEKNDAEIKKDIWKGLTNNKCESSSEARKEIEDAIDLKKEEGGIPVRELLNELSGSKKALTDLKKSLASADKVFKDLIKDIEKDIKAVKASDDNAEETLKNKSRELNVTKIEATVCSESSSLCIECSKRDIKYQRSLANKVLNFNRKKLEESALLSEAMTEVSDYEIDSAFDC